MPILMCLLLVLTSCAEEDPSARAARVKAEEMARDFERDLEWDPEDVGYVLSHEKDVEVFSVSGTQFSVSDPGRVVVRVRGQGSSGGGFFGGVPTPRPAVVVCFEITVSYGNTDVGEVDCPPGEPRTFRPPAELPDRALERLEERLPKTVDLAAARRAVQALDLDDRIGQDVAEFHGVIGVALREGPGRCLFARVRAAGVEVWWPSRIQVMPGEGSCSAAEAAYGYAQRPPH
jgi:hypothetical protein